MQASVLASVYRSNNPIIFLLTTALDGWQELTIFSLLKCRLIIFNVYPQKNGFILSSFRAKIFRDFESLWFVSSLQKESLPVLMEFSPFSGGGVGPGSAEVKPQQLAHQCDRCERRPHHSQRAHAGRSEEEPGKNTQKFYQHLGSSNQDTSSSTLSSNI